MDDPREVLKARSLANWKREQTRILVSRWLRWGFGVPLLLSCILVPLFGLFLGLLGAILIAPDVASFLTNRLVGSSRQEKLPPMYGIPESLMAKGKYADAEQEYEKIIQAFPDEVKPHIDLIHIAVDRLNDGDLAEQLFQRGMGLLKKMEGRQLLTEAYQRERSRLKTPENARGQRLSADKLQAARSINEKRFGRRSNLPEA